MYYGILGSQGSHSAGILTKVVKCMWYMRWKKPKSIQYKLFWYLSILLRTNSSSNNNFGQPFLKNVSYEGMKQKKKKKLGQWIKGRKSTLEGLKFLRMAEAQGALEHLLKRRSCHYRVMNHKWFGQIVLQSTQASWLPRTITNCLKIQQL